MLVSACMTAKPSSVSSCMVRHKMYCLLAAGSEQSASQNSWRGRAWPMRHGRRGSVLPPSRRRRRQFRSGLRKPPL